MTDKPEVLSYDELSDLVEKVVYDTRHDGDDQPANAGREFVRLLEQLCGTRELWMIEGGEFRPDGDGEGVG